MAFKPKIVRPTPDSILYGLPLNTLLPFPEEAPRFVGAYDFKNALAFICQHLIEHCKETELWKDKEARNIGFRDWTNDFYNPILKTLKDDDGTYPLSCKKGKLGKRVVRWVYNHFTYNLPEKIVMRLSDEINKAAVGTKAVGWYDFTKTFDWKSGDYDDGGSCWVGRIKT